jgi:hypothetical protein
MADSIGSKRKSDDNNPLDKRFCPQLAFSPAGDTPAFYGGIIVGKRDYKTVGPTSIVLGLPTDFYRGYFKAMFNLDINSEDQPIAYPVATLIEEPSASQTLPEKSDSGLSDLIELIAECTQEPPDALGEFMPSRTASVESSGSGPICPLVD